MKKRKLNYRFHDPNTAETAANYLLKVLIEANTSKVEQAIQQSADRQIEEEQRGGCRTKNSLCPMAGIHALHGIAAIFF